MSRDENLTPAVIYIRMSSGKQEASPGQQRAEVAKLAKKHNCKILREYFDEAISGDATDKRKGFQQMIRDAEEKGDFAAILCWDQDRFGRFDSIEAGRWIYPLREAGVWLITVGQGRIDWNDFASRMIYSVVQDGKHQFLIDLSKNVLRGKIEAARKGRGSNTPAYGYDRAYYDQQGNLVKLVPYGERFTKPRDWAMRFVLSKDADAVKIVRWVFGTFADTDCGLSWLAGDLNRREVPSPQGKTWSIQTIARILNNRAYTGANVFGDGRYGKYHHMGRGGEITSGRDRRGDVEPIVVEGVHDRLVDKQTFERVQSKLVERATSGQRPRHNRYVLSGVLRCGHCGGTLAGKGYHSGNVPRYYACVTGNTRPGACCRYQIQQRAIEDYVLGVIEEKLLADDAIDRIKRAIHRRAKGKAGFKGQAKSLKAKIDALDRKVAKGTENMLLADQEHIPDLSRMLAEWKQERDRLQSRLETAASRPDGREPQEAAQRAIAELTRLRDHLKTGDPMKVRAVVKSMVEEVRLWWEPYGKRNKRLAHGTLQFRSDLEVLSRDLKTASATSSAPDTNIE